MDPSLHITDGDASSQLPAVFGRYLLLKRLSRGGMGEIFLAKHGLEGFEKLCVIKKVLPQLSADQHFISRFVDEAQVAVHLQHANVAQVFEVGCVGNEYFLALEYVEGRDLRRILGRLAKSGRRFPVDMALLVARELANGLAYAHRRTSPSGEPLHLVHCDISPPNVVISFEGEVKIIDFGIAKSAMRVTQTDPKMGFGKFGYMSPEQLVRGAKVDHRTDIYAAGAVLFEMLTSTRLHDVGDSRDYRALVKQVLDGKHARPSDIDVTLMPFDDVVMRAVHAQVKKRFQGANELRDAIQQLLVQRNPTISSDSLAEFMRDVYGDRVHELRELARDARATALDPWQHEIEDQSHSSVSFARADLNAPSVLDVGVAQPFAPPPARAPDALRVEAARGRDSEDAPTRVWRGQASDAVEPGAAPPRADASGARRTRFIWLAILILVVAGLVAVALADRDGASEAPAPATQVAPES